jgi:hypothetical protein
MRTFLAFVSGLVAFVAALITVPTLWVSTHVADEDGYVRLSSALAQDAAIQRAFAGYLSNDLTSRGVIPASLEQVATVAMTQVAALETNAPGFLTAWEKTQRNFHRTAFADSSKDTLTVDAGPMAQFVASRVKDRLPVSLTVPRTLVVPVGDAQDREAIDTVKKSTGASRIGLVVVAVASLAALLLARRRSVAVMWLGLGAAVAAGLLWIASNIAAPRIIDHTAAPSQFARTFQKLLVDRAADSLDVWLLWIAVGGAAVAVVGLAGRAVTGRSA